MTAREAERRLTAQELTEWVALAEVQTYGEEREDRRAAALLTTYINTHIGKGKKRIQPDDVFGAFERPRHAQQTPDDHIRILSELRRNHG